MKPSPGELLGALKRSPTQNRQQRRDYLRSRQQLHGTCLDWSVWEKTSTLFTVWVRQCLHRDVMPQHGLLTRKLAKDAQLSWIELDAPALGRSSSYGIKVVPSTKANETPISVLKFARTSIMTYGWDLSLRQSCWRVGIHTTSCHGSQAGKLRGGDYQSPRLQRRPCVALFLE